MKVRLFDTLRNYKTEYFKNDLFAGIIIAAMTIPISMGYAEVAGLQAVYGLYASILPLLCFAAFSTSGQLIFGVDAAPAAIIASSIAGLGITAGSEEAMRTIPVIAFLTGIWLLIFYIFRAGRVVGFISNPVMGGFISGISVTIIMMQLPKILGFKAAHGELFTLIPAIWHAAASIHWLSFALGAGTLLIIIISQRLFPKFPMAIFMMAGGALLTYYGHIDNYGVALLASVEPGIPALTFPELSSVNITECLGTSLTVAVVVMSETLLAENNFAFKNGYKLDDNSELLACAAGNLAASFTGGCSVNGSVSRTAMGEQFKGRTQMMSIVAALILTALLMFGTGFIGYLPVPVLTAIVISALMRVIEGELALRLFRVSRSEFWIFMGAFASVLILGTIYGVVIGIVLSFAEVVLRASKPPRALLGVIPGHGNFYSLERNRNARQIEHVVIYRFSSNLFFANVNSLQEDIENAIMEDTECVIIDASGISNIDITAADRLEALYKKLKERGIRLYMTEHIGAVNDQLGKLGFEYLIREGFVRRTITLALKDAGYERPYTLIDSDGVILSQGEYSQSIKAEEEESLEEYTWAFGSDAAAQMEKDVSRIIENIGNEGKQKAAELSDVLSAAEKSSAWGGLGSIDEDELLRRLELHTKEISTKLHNNETAVAELIEHRRREIARYLESVSPQAAKRLHEHQRQLEERLKKENPEGYEYLKRLKEQSEKMRELK